MRSAKCEVRSANAGMRSSVLECGDASPLLLRDPHFHRSKRREPRLDAAGSFLSLRFLCCLLFRLSSTESARGLAQSKTWRWASALCLLNTAFCLCVHAQTFNVDWYAVDGGGGTCSGSNFVVTATIGEPDADRIRGNTFTVDGGFWSPFAPPPAPVGIPVLRIALVSSSSVVVAWPYPSEGYGLQQCTNLITANWMADASVPVHVGGEWQVTVSPPAGRRYYRLQK